MTNESDIVFDPYVGVGSTIIAAMKHDRIGFGCDIESAYVDIAWQRVNAFRMGALQTRPMNKPVYDPALKYGGHR